MVKLSTEIGKPDEEKDSDPRSRICPLNRIYNLPKQSPFELEWTLNSPLGNLSSRSISLSRLLD